MTGAQVELKGMADRIKTMRTKLFEALQAERVPGCWSHVVEQIGMCAPSPLPPPAVVVSSTLQRGCYRHWRRHTAAASQCSFEIKCRSRQ